MRRRLSTQVCAALLSLAPTSTAVAQQRFAGGAPPPPPPPPPSFGKSQNKIARPGLGAGPMGSAKGFRTPPEILEALIPYIPTFFVDNNTVLREIPLQLHDMFGTMKFPAFLRKYRFYFDVRVNHGQAEVRLRENMIHPKRGQADALYSLGMSSSDMHSSIAQSFNAAEGGAENGAAAANAGPKSFAPLVAILYQQCPAAYTPLGELLSTAAKSVMSHPHFDANVGVSGILEKYPEHFQIVDGSVRRRPVGIAPNAIGDLDASSSPVPEVIEKVLGELRKKAAVTIVAEGEEPPATVMDTTELFAMLSVGEKQAVKREAKAFPRFLRQHGTLVSVSPDNQKVTLFDAEKDKATYKFPQMTVEDVSGGSTSNSALTEAGLIPETMNEGVVADVDWAVKELYDALPVMQAVELEEIQHIVSDAVRHALPKDLGAVLAAYPEYFAVWQYPDDETVTVVQRGRLTTPEYEDNELVTILMPLIPQGGLTVDKLLRKVPLPVQRHLYKHGVKARLQPLSEYFLVAGGKVMCIAE